MDLTLTSLARAETGPVDFSIRPVLETGGCIYLVGKGGSGKSTLISDLCLARADASMRFMDKPELPASPWPDGKFAGGTLQIENPVGLTLIVDGENTDRVWRRMCEKTLASYDVNPQSDYAQKLLDRILHARSTKYNLNQPGNRRLAQEALVQVALHNGVGCIIIDPVWKVYSPPNPAESEWVTDGISYLRDLCLEREITLLCVAHPAADSKDRTGERKAQPFGSSQQVGMYDCHLHLKRDDGHGTLTMWKTRAADWLVPGTDKVRLEYGQFGGGYKPTKDPWPLTEPPDGKFLTKAAFDMLRGLPRELFRLDQVNNSTLKTSRKHIEGELVKAGFVEHAHGEGLKGDPKLYKVTKEGLEHITYKTRLAKTSKQD